MSDSVAALLIDVAGHVVGITLDGSTYRLEISSKTKNVAGTFVNPATEDTLANVATETKLEAVRVLLNSLDGKDYATQTTLAVLAGKDFATQTTLATLASESKLEAVRVLLVSIDNKDFATQATLTAVDAKLATIDAVLDSIKDTDGIKKITDQLPVGTNEIGKVAQGTKAIGSAAWPQVLYDATGNPVTVTLDGAVYRLETYATMQAGTSEIGKVAQGTKALPADAWPMVLYDASGNPIGITLDGSLYRIETRTRLTDGTNYQGFILDTENDDAWRAQTEALLAPGSTVNIGTGIPSNPADLVIDYCKNGTSYDMLVNGSSTPAHFDFGPPAGEIYTIQELLLVFTADDFSFDGESFGPTNELTNGIDVKTVITSVTTTLSSIIRNEDFLRFPGRSPIVNNTGPKDLLSASLDFGALVKLDGDDGDVIRVTINDNLTGTKLKYLTGTVFASKET